MITDMNVGFSQRGSHVPLTSELPRSINGTKSKFFQKFSAKREREIGWYIEEISIVRGRLRNAYVWKTLQNLQSSEEVTHDIQMANVDGIVKGNTERAGTSLVVQW